MPTHTHTHGYLNKYLCEDLDSIEVGDKQGGGEEKRREIKTIAPCIVNVGVADIKYCV